MIGETLGSYRIIGRVGAGGMGEVYLAEHTRIDRRAAIKVLLPELSSNHDVVERFFAEARATSSIRHHGIVEVLDCAVHTNKDGERAYIVMELLEGESLAARLERDRGFGQDVDRVLAIAAAVADAVAAAHAKGIVHRDLKPDNIFLVGDDSAALGFGVKILDFGIAKLLRDGERSGASSRTRTGSMLGTPAYMSPEQCRGAGQVDHRTDIYSLGCIVFEMLTGRRPFLYEGFGELIAAHLNEQPPSLESLGVQVSPAVEVWLARLLAKARADRFATMAEVSAGAASLRHRTTAVLPSSPGVVAGGTAVISAVGAPTAPGRASGSAGGTVMLPTPRPGALSGGSTSTTTTLSAHASESVPRGGAGRGKWMAAALGGLALIGGLFFLLRPSPSPTPPPAPARPAVPETVVVDVSDAPEGMRAWVDGAPATLPIRLPAGADTHELLFRAPGFHDRSLPPV